MSTPPDPNNPYAHNPYGAQQPPGGYGYPQQGTPPGYGYPQQGAPPGYGYPQYPGGGLMGMPQRMPGQVVTARVLLFVAGGLHALMALVLLLAGSNEFWGSAVRNAAVAGILVFVALAALHLVPASLFGRGGTGVRVTAIIAASLNTLFPLVGLIGSLNGVASPGAPVAVVLWIGTAVTTLVFCSMSQAGEWFARPRY